MVHSTHTKHTQRGKLIGINSAHQHDVRMATAKLIKPTDPRSRIVVIDAIRGFALFGLLLFNMYNFGAYSAVRRIFVWGLGFGAATAVVFETAATSKLSGVSFGK